MSAIDLNARASKDFDAKLAETIALLQQAAIDYAPLTTGGASRVTQANSLGAEDVVVSHLINSLQLDIGIFVLETGMLHPETLALLDRLKATSRAPVEVYTPGQRGRGGVCGARRQGRHVQQHCAAQRVLQHPQDGAAGARPQRQRRLDHRAAP